MMGHVSLPIRRSFAVAILLALVSMMFSGIVQPFLDGYRDARVSVERLEAAMQRDRVGERELAQLQTELTALQKRQSSTGGFLRGTNESIAAAQLQERLKTSVEGARGELKSTQILPARDDGKFRRITVRAQISLSMEALQRTLYEVESSAPFLFLDNVIIRVRSTPKDRNRSVEDPVLDVSFDLSGYLRRPI